MQTEPEFLAGESIGLRLRKMIPEAKDASLAVAFWGRGAARQLGLEKRHAGGGRRRTRILCDLMSGCCNPEEISLLMQLRDNGLEIRALEYLHAKVYLCDRAVIIGSANASTNGLGEENSMLASLRSEACVYMDGSALVADIVSWFNKLWERATTITADSIDDARRTWSERRRQSQRAVNASVDEQQQNLGRQVGCVEIREKDSVIRFVKIGDLVDFREAGVFGVFRQDRQCVVLSSGSNMAKRLLTSLKYVPTQSMYRPAEKLVGERLDVHVLAQVGMEKERDRMRDHYKAKLSPIINS